MAKTPRLVNANELKQFLVNLLSTVGISTQNAKSMADVFIWANLRGVDSHGVARIPRYIELFESGEANKAPNMVEQQPKPSVINIDADFAPGPVAISRAVDLAAKLAKQQGVGWVQVKHTVHAGAIGYYVERAANLGVVGIAMLAGMPNMAYPGAKGPAVATSPFAVGIPAKGTSPFLLDMATATIALGKIKQYKIKGLPLPENAAVTAEGIPTTDASEAKMPLPLGGMKGAGMSLAFELMTSVLVGSPIVAPFHAKAEGAKKHRQNAVIICVDPAVFGDPDIFGAAVADTMQSIRNLEPLDTDSPVGVPGDRGSAIALQRAANGIPVPNATWDNLEALAKKYELKLPS